MTPTFDKEDLKVNKVSRNANILQVLQNKMIRIILGIRKNHHVNMSDLRNKIRIMSVNQMCVYHTILEAHNIMRNVSSEQIKRKWTYKEEMKYFLRNKTENDLKIPGKPLTNCIGFTYSLTKRMSYHK